MTAALGRCLMHCRRLQLGLKQLFCRELQATLLLLLLLLAPKTPAAAPMEPSCSSSRLRT